MTEEILIAGFGGQGVLSMGMIMAYSGMLQDMEVSWMPSYGPEMRGGTANVIVILSNERISSPIIRHFDTVIILNQQSLDKFEQAVKPGGVLIYDSNGISRHPERKDISVYRIDATEEAIKMNSPKTFNMIVLGGFLRIKPVLTMEDVVAGLKKSLPERYHKMIPENERSLKRGGEIIREINKV
ncbi:MAG: 2-oxoglutarate ferredoxin oxidoreductase subunit gamma [Bacteroidales bacterium]|nr:2-oxoglutarate ferredoxin oxidoreductase subunit gamma [Bacteroidales bacterium]